MRIRALAIRIIRQFVRDKRTLALLFLAPLLVLTLMNFVFNGREVKPELGIVGIPQTIETRLEQAGADVTVYQDFEAAETAIRDGKLDAVVRMNDGQPSVLLEGSDPTVTRSVMLTLQKAMQANSQNAPALTVDYLHGKEDL
jgi:ABC-2 type transport system permease protein